MAATNKTTRKPAPKGRGLMAQARRDNPTGAKKATAKKAAKKATAKKATPMSSAAKASAEGLRRSRAMSSDLANIATLYRREVSALEPKFSMAEFTELVSAAAAKAGISLAIVVARDDRELQRAIAELQGRPLIGCEHDSESDQQAAKRIHITHPHPLHIYEPGPKPPKPEPPYALWCVENEDSNCNPDETFLGPFKSKERAEQSMSPKHRLRRCRRVLASDVGVNIDELVEHICDAMDSGEVDDAFGNYEEPMAKLVPGDEAVEAFWAWANKYIIIDAHLPEPDPETTK